MMTPCAHDRRIGTVCLDCHQDAEEPTPVLLTATQRSLVGEILRHARERGGQHGSPALREVERILNSE